MNKLQNFLSMNKKALVNTFIIGVQKGGTSSLFSYLLQHPSCSGGNLKEIHFFDNDETYSRGIKEYHSYYTYRRKVMIDASPSYIYRRPVIQRIKAYNPNAKFIVLLRDPIDRAYSAWNMYKQLYAINREYYYLKKGRNRNNRIAECYFSHRFPSFKEAVQQELDWMNNEEEIEEPSIVRRGFYSEQLQSWLEHYPKENFFIGISEDFKIRKGKILNELCAFLEIENIDWKLKQLNDLHVRKYDEELDPENRSRLIEIYRAKNNDLPDLLGFTPQWQIF